MSGTTKEKGPRQRAFSKNTSNSAKQGSAIRIMESVDGPVNNYRQFILCTDARAEQVKAWLPGVRIARVSIRPFMSGYQLRAGVGEWFRQFATRDAGVVCWCTERVGANEPVLELSRAAHGIRWVELREEGRA